VTSANLHEACIEYVGKREQMGARKAAAHVMQQFGVTSSELSAALADEGLLLVQRIHADDPMETA
jgi:hypothetical protein